MFIIFVNYKRYGKQAATSRLIILAADVLKARSSKNSNRGRIPEKGGQNPLKSPQITSNLKKK
jgi:hypothetical protein